MKPTPQQTIDGVRALLRDAVAPELSSPRAVAAFRRAMSALRDLDCNDAVFRLIDETAELTRLLDELDDLARPCAALAPASAPRESMAAPRSFAEAQRQNLQRRAELLDLVERARRAAADAATTPDARAALAQIGARTAACLAELHRGPRPRDAGAGPATLRDRQGAP